MLLLPDELLVIVAREVDFMTRRQLHRVCHRLSRICNTVGFELRPAVVTIPLHESFTSSGGNSVDSLMYRGEMVSKCNALNIRATYWYLPLNWPTPNQERATFDKYKSNRAKGLTWFQGILATTNSLEYLRLEGLESGHNIHNLERAADVYAIHLLNATRKVAVLEVTGMPLNARFFSVNDFCSLRELRLCPSYFELYGETQVNEIVRVLTALPLSTLTLAVTLAAEFPTLSLCAQELKQLRHLTFDNGGKTTFRRHDAISIQKSEFCGAVRSNTLEVLLFTYFPPFYSTARHGPGARKRKRVGMRPKPGISESGIYDTDLVEGSRDLQGAFPRLRSLAWLVPRPHGDGSERLWSERTGEDASWVYAGANGRWQPSERHKLFESIS